MGNKVSVPYSFTDSFTGLHQIPNHVLLDIFSFLNAEDVASCSLVCKKWHYLLNIAPKRLQKLHILRISVDCRFIGQDVVWVRDHRNDGSTILIHGSTKSNTQSKIRRLTCEELRICGSKTDDRSLVAVDPTWFTIVASFSWKTLSRIYIFRANLFRFTERDVAQLSNLLNLVLLSVSGVEEANAFTDTAVEPLIEKGTLEKLVLDHTNISDASLLLLAKCCRKLSLLSFWGCYDCTETGVGYIARQRLLYKMDPIKVICRQTMFNCEQFLVNFPQFTYSSSGRSLENSQRKIAIHFC